MANPTTYFGWVMPNSADLVTDLPADFAVFGQGVDTSMQYLLGGTTGQVLSKTSGTNMAFTWINNDQGDITGVTAGTGISVTSPTGPVPTVAIDTTVTVDKTTAQTLTNKTLTSPALTTPTISTATTNGDLLYGTGSGALARLGIGSSAQVLTVASGIPSWATPAAPTFVGCSLTKSAAQSIPNATETVVTFDTEAFDTDGFHSGSDGKITVPSGKAGKYLVTAQIMVNSSGSQTQGGMRKNGSATSIFTYYASTTGAALMVLVNTVVNLAVADYLEIFVYQGSGTAKDVLANNYTASASVFSVSYLGA